MEVLLILDTPADLFDVAGSNYSQICSKWEREANDFDLEYGTGDALRNEHRPSTGRGGKAQ